MPTSEELSYGSRLSRKSRPNHMAAAEEDDDEAAGADRPSGVATASLSIVI